MKNLITGGVSKLVTISQRQLSVPSRSTSVAEEEPSAATAAAATELPSVPETGFSPVTPAPDAGLSADRGRIRISRSGAPVSTSDAATADAAMGGAGGYASQPPMYSVHATARAVAADADAAAQARFHHANPHVEDLGATWPPPAGGVPNDHSPMSARPIQKKISFRQAPKHSELLAPAQGALYCSLDDTIRACLQCLGGGAAEI